MASYPSGLVNSASRPPTHAALRGVVSSFWLSHRVGSETADVVLPNGRAQLVLDLDAGTALLVGPRTTCAQVQIPRTTAGLAFTAMGLHGIADVPAHELVDEVVEVDELWGDSRWLRHLEHARSTHELLSGLERETVRHLRTRAPDPRLVAAERAIRTGMEPGFVATAVGADRRWLVPEFRHVLGVAPKHYQRIVRFQTVLRALRVADPAPLATIAASVGYADQAHMCREFKSMAGVIPSQLHGVSSARPNHLTPFAEP
jgi:AraC-like DNA-binding protein